jgi:hypothetical protein
VSVRWFRAGNSGTWHGTVLATLIVIATLIEIVIYFISKLSDKFGKAAAMVTTFPNGVSVVGATLVPWL